MSNEIVMYAQYVNEYSKLGAVLFGAALAAITLYRVSANSKKHQISLEFRNEKLK